MANTTTNQANGATKGQPQPAKARGTQAAASSMPRRRCPHRPGLPATGRHQASPWGSSWFAPFWRVAPAVLQQELRKRKKSLQAELLSLSRAVPSCVASAQARACSKRACERASKAKRPAASCSKLKRPGGSTQAAPPPPQQQQASMATLRSQAGKAGKQGTCGRDKVKARQQGISPAAVQRQAVSAVQSSSSEQASKQQAAGGRSSAQGAPQAQVVREVLDRCRRDDPWQTRA